MTNKTSIFLRAAALCIVHCALCIPLSASAVTITATATAVKAGDPTPITATVSGGTVDHLYLVYQIAGSSYAWNTNEMDSVSATQYTGAIPPLTGAVTVEWYVTDGGTASSAPSTTALAANPGYNRYHDGAVGVSKVWRVTTSIQEISLPSGMSPDTVNGWKYDSGSYSNITAQAPNGSQWKASGVGIAVSKATIGSPGVDTDIGMAYPSLYFMNLPPSEMPFIRSPKLEGGVGTIDFRTRLIDTGLMKSSELTLQIAYTDEEPTETDWVDYKVYGYGTQNGSVFSRICHEVLNDYGVTYVRILRTGFNFENEDITSGRLAVDNICITKPAADVGIIEKLKNPGYPAADQDILMRCAVTNVCEDTPAVNRRVSVKYQYVARDTYSPNDGAWSSADMAYMGKDANGLDWYEGTIPTQRVGYVWYYYQVDYDGYAWSGTLKNYNNAIVNADESISPAYWDAGVDTHVRPVAGTKFQVRPYRSRYGHVAIEAFPAEASIPEMTLVDNEQWLAVVPVSGITVISNYFVGYGYYAEDAEAYEADAVIWGENNPDALSDPTLAGYLESTHDNTSVTNRLVVLNEKNYKGSYLYRFSSNDLDEEAAQSQDGDRRYDYIVKKAVYQDFDDWTASPTYYESSLGGLPTLTFAEDFDGNAASIQSGAICATNAWMQDGYASGDRNEEDFQVDVISDVFSSSPVKTPGKFIRRNSRVLKDRKAKNTVEEKDINKTMALALGGQIENTKDSIPYGLEKITFKARASIDDRNFAVYKGGTAWTLPLYITAQWQLSQVAPSKPYLSYMFLYQPTIGGHEDSWYELRIVQTDSANANNDTVNVELWKHLSTGEETKVASKDNFTGRNLRNGQSVNLYIDTNGNNLRVRVHLTGGNASTIANNTTANTALLQDTSPINLTEGGTIGFGVYDAVPNITSLKVTTAYSGGTTLLASIGAETTKPNYNWDRGGRRSDGEYRWNIQTGSITRPLPAQTIGLYAANCVGSESTAEVDELPLTPTDTRSVSSLTLQDFTVDFKAWNKKFVQIRYTDGDGGVVLDDIVYYPWRASTRYSQGEATLRDIGYRDWTTKDQQEQWLDSSPGATEETMRQHWAVFEGWVVENPGGFHIGANFERSRANTNLIQGVVSPELENGLGSCSFSYTVSGGKVVYGIERSNETSIHTWTPVAVFMNNAGEKGERYAKIGVNYGDSGRIRVRIYGPQEVAELPNYENYADMGYDPSWGYTDENAKIMFDNLRVKDYPEDENHNAWHAYNILVTGDAPDGQIYNNSGKSCFLNNSPTNGTYVGGETYDEDDSYLESPPLTGVGVGEIAFQYRLVPGTGSGNGTIVIKVAPRSDAEEFEWKTITNLVVYADGTAFVKFDNDKIFDENNFVVRFYNPVKNNPGAPRIVIDNVLVTAPARPSFEFEYVALMPEQPISGTNTAVEAKIMREIMNPKGIQVYVSYHKYDTNVVNEAWGIANWFNPNDTRSRIRMSKVEEDNPNCKVFRTPAGEGIPAFNPDDVVEFVVWGVHDDIKINAGDSPIVQDRETFEAPAWYRKVDWDAQEIVPMDINIDKAAEGWSPYYWVFSCPPGTFFVNEINYWRTANGDTDAGSAEYIEFAGRAGTDIGGWKLIVKHNQLDLNGGKDWEYVIPVGTHLRSATDTGWGFFLWGDSCSSDTFTIDSQPPRENVPFNVDAAFPDSANRFDRHLGTYAGIMILRPNGMVEEALRYGPQNQAVFSNEETIWGENTIGRKKSGTEASLSRISPFDGRGELVPCATAADFIWWNSDLAEEDEYDNVDMLQTPGAPNTVQVFADLGGGVVAALYYPDGTEITDADVLAWIEHYGADQSDINALGTNAKVDEEFLLNLDLTKTCVAELKITSVRIEAGVVYLGVQLTRTEDNVAVGTRKINGTLKLLGRADLTAGVFTPLNAAFIGDDDFSTGNTTAVEYDLPGSNPPKFFKVSIE